MHRENLTLQFAASTRKEQLLELLLELIELPAQAFDFRGETLNPVFKTHDLLGFSRFARLFVDRWRAVGLFELHVTGQQLRKARLFLPCLARQLNYHRLGILRAQRMESLFNFFQSGSLVEPVGAPANFTR